MGKYRTIAGYLFSIFRIAFAHYGSTGNLLRESVSFGITGLLTNAVNYTVFILLLNLLGVVYGASSMAGFLAGLLVGFAVNRTWTFRAAQGRIQGQSARFLAVNAVSLAVNLATIVLVTEVVGLVPELSQLFAITASTVINFIGSKFWAFRVDARRA